MAELLVVVAIIAVLVAISIPIFTFQLHKAQVATDMANVRSYYAQLQHEYMETGKIDKSKLKELGIKGESGLTSFELSGAKVELKAGQLWIAPEGDNKGYNLLYICDNYDCSLILPENQIYKIACNLVVARFSYAKK